MTTTSAAALPVKKHPPPPLPKHNPLVIKISLIAFWPDPQPIPPCLILYSLHAHTCTHQVLYKGETTAWLQLHKHNFWQHYCTLKPTVYFFFVFKREPLFVILLTRCLTTDPLTQFHSRLSGWVGCILLVAPFSHCKEGKILRLRLMGENTESRCLREAMKKEHLTTPLKKHTHAPQNN